MRGTGIRTALQSRRTFQFALLCLTGVASFFVTSPRWRIFKAALLLSLFAVPILAEELPRKDRGEEPAGNDPLTIESASDRAMLPLYKTIPAAKDKELTAAAKTDRDNHRTWSRSNADAGNTRYSALTQINRNNVSKLAVAWVYHSKDGKGNLQANPIVVDGVMYAPTVGKDMVAVNAATGVELWRFHPPGTGTGWLGYGPAQRGLIYRPGKDPRLFFTSGKHLYALNPKTGRPIETFGEHGKAPADGVVAPAIYKNIIVAPNLNVVDAFDVATGTHLWKFELKEANCWAGMAMDTVRGIAYIQVGDPHLRMGAVSPRNQVTNNGHSNSVLALDAKTGRLLWSFQSIAHDLWDIDVSAAPNLVTVTRNGRRVDAVAQATKQGITLLLDRVSGKPLFPFRMRRAPVSKIPGERTWPYQPDIELPQPFARQTFTREDLTDINPAAHDFVAKQVNQANVGWFEPFEEGKATIFYGIHGGAEWPGAAFDPTTGWLYVSSNEIPWTATVSRLAPRATRDPNAPPTAGAKVFEKNCAVCHGKDREGQGMAPSLIGLGGRLGEEMIVELLKTGRGAMPPLALPGDDRVQLLDFLLDRDLPASAQPGPPKPATDPSVRYGVRVSKLYDDRSYPGSKPPWGTLNAIDLNSGKLVWQAPLGEYDELTREGVPKTGTENFGGATVTAGGLVFCAGTRDLKIRAFDKEDGRELWQYQLPFGGYAPPSTYEVDGRQYVVIAATGGGKLGGNSGDTYVAFALPKSGQGGAER